jgi:hypothetical protein
MRRLASSVIASVAALGCLLHALPAAAQVMVYPPPPPPPFQPPPPPQYVVEPAGPRGEIGSGDVRYTDANADRVILGSTAETHPQGTFFLTDYEIFLLQLGYSITDSFQLSLTGVVPVIKGQPYFFDLAGKFNLVRGRVFRAAVTGAVDMVTTGSTSGSNVSSGPYWGGRLGAVGQFCFNETCRSSLSLSAGTVLTSGASEVLPVYGAAGLIVNVSPVVSLLVEPTLAGLVGTGSGSVGSGSLISVDYGVRLGGKNFAVDLTFIEPVGLTTGSINNPFVIGYPFVAFTYRTDGDRRPK